MAGIIIFRDYCTQFLYSGVVQSDSNCNTPHLHSGVKNVALLLAIIFLQWGCLRLSLKELPSFSTVWCSRWELFPMIDRRLANTLFSPTSYTESNGQSKGELPSWPVCWICVALCCLEPSSEKQRLLESEKVLSRGLHIPSDLSLFRRWSQIGPFLYRASMLWDWSTSFLRLHFTSCAVLSSTFVHACQHTMHAFSCTSLLCCA